jgi:hypothetical protein
MNFYHGPKSLAQSGKQTIAGVGNKNQRCMYTVRTVHTYLYSMSESYMHNTLLVVTIYVHTLFEFILASMYVPHIMKFILYIVLLFNNKQ